METALGMLFALIFLLIGLQSNRKRAGNAGATRARPGKPAAPAAANDGPDPAAAQARLQEIADTLSDALPVAPAAPEGASALDLDEECAGGSMAHVHTEGESRKEHRRHMEKVHRQEAETLLASAQAERREAARLQRLREAVVMAEVLERPVALRPRRAAAGRAGQAR